MLKRLTIFAVVCAACCASAVALERPTLLTLEAARGTQRWMMDKKAPVKQDILQTVQSLAQQRVAVRGGNSIIIRIVAELNPSSIFHQQILGTLLKRAVNSSPDIFAQALNNAQNEELDPVTEQALLEETQRRASEIVWALHDGFIDAQTFSQSVQELLPFQHLKEAAANIQFCATLAKKMVANPHDEISDLAIVQQFPRPENELFTYIEPTGDLSILHQDPGSLSPEAVKLLAHTIGSTLAQHAQAIIRLGAPIADYPAEIQQALETAPNRVVQIQETYDPIHFKNGDLLTLVASGPLSSERQQRQHQISAEIPLRMNGELKPVRQMVPALADIVAIPAASFGRGAALKLKVRAASVLGQLVPLKFSTTLYGASHRLRAKVCSVMSASAFGVFVLQGSKFESGTGDILACGIAILALIVGLLALYFAWLPGEAVQIESGTQFQASVVGRPKPVRIIR